MSNPKPNNTEGSGATRTRQTRPRDEAEEGEETQPSQPSAHVSPAMRIYRHALESIFAMLDVSDLILALAVSRSWSAAVRSMAPIHASLDRDDRGSIRCSTDAFDPEHRGIFAHAPSHRYSYLGDGPSYTLMDNAALSLLAQHAPNLQSLWCQLDLAPNEPLVLPAKLTSLNLQIGGEYTDAEINGVLTTVAALPSLSRLSLKLSAFFDECDIELSRLAACRSLTDLTLRTSNGGAPVLTNAQVDEIRSSLGHLHRFTLRNRSHISFLPQLPQLSALSVSCLKYR